MIICPNALAHVVEGKAIPNLLRTREMASRNLQLPDQEECFALTDEQCRRIMDYQDPNGIRSNRDWEAEHQPLLIRLYMAMWIFPDIEHYMQSKITAS